MQYKISKQAASASINIIDEILAVAGDYDDFISLSAGSPAFETFPLEKLKEYAVKAYEAAPMDILSYPPTQGLDSIRGEIMKWLEGRGFDTKDRELFLTSGSGPGIDTMCSAFLDEGDVVFMEDIAYCGIIDASRVRGAKIVTIKTGDTGIDLEDLEAKAAEYSPKFLYVIPTFSNPCGVTMDLEKRKGIYEIAQKYDFMIYEDDPYSQLRFKGEHVKELVNMDPDGRVVHAETFSKYLAPGLRMGFLLFHKDVLDPIVYAFGNAGGPSAPVQEMAAQFMMHEDFPAQIRKAAAYYEKQCKITLDALDKYLPEGFTRTDPEGGMFVWVTCPDTIDTDDLCWSLVRGPHVGIIPSSCFAPDKSNPGHGFRISYSIATPEEIEKGVKAIGDMLRERI